MKFWTDMSELRPMPKSEWSAYLAADPERLQDVEAELLVSMHHLQRENHDSTYRMPQDGVLIGVDPDSAYHDSILKVSAGLCRMMMN